MVEDQLALVAPWGVELARVRVPVAVWHGEQDLGVPAPMAAGLPV